MDSIKSVDAEVSGATLSESVVYAAKTVPPGASIDPHQDGKSWYHISSSGSELQIDGQTEGQVILITNTDKVSSHTVSHANIIFIIKAASTAQFIFTGSYWSGYADTVETRDRRR